MSTPYLQCGRILGVTRDGRMVLCQLPLGNHKLEECMNFKLREGSDYVLIGEFQRKATA